MAEEFGTEDTNICLMSDETSKLGVGCIGVLRPFDTF